MEQARVYSYRDKVFITNCQRCILTYPCIAYFGSELDVSDSYRTAPFVEGKQSPGQRDPGFPRAHVRVVRNTSTFNTDIQYSPLRIGSGMRYVLPTCGFFHGSNEPRVILKTPAPACPSAEASLSP